MRNPKTALALVVATVVLTAWAGSNAVASKPRSGKDRTVVAQAQSSDEAKKPDQAVQPRPKEDQDQAPKSGDRDAQAPESKSDEVAKPEHNAVQTRQSKPEVIRAPDRSEPEVRNYTGPGRIQTTQSGGSGGKGETNIPQPGGEPRRPRGGDNRGGYQGGPGHDPFDRRPSHFYGGGGWHGRHDEWRHRHFHGSWRFLFHFGPVIYFAPIHYPHIIRIPHDRVGVFVRYTGEDVVGERFAESVREHLREEGLPVVYSQDDAKLELYVISMEQDPDDPGYGSSISVSYIWYPGHRFITAQMVDAGLNEVDDLAASVAGYVDDLVDEYR